MPISILDQVAPYTRFHIGMSMTDVDGSLIQCVQLLNRDDEAVMNVRLRNGEPWALSEHRRDRAFIALPEIEAHAEYFIAIAQRYANTHKPK